MKKLLLLLSFCVVLSAESVCEYTVNEAMKNINISKAYSEREKYSMACIYTSQADYWLIQASVECTGEHLDIVNKLLDINLKIYGLLKCK